MPALLGVALFSLGFGSPALADNAPDNSVVLEEDDESSVAYFKQVRSTDTDWDDPTTGDHLPPNDDKVVVPEPGTLGLLAAGLVVLGVARYRRRR
jgi:hypothetical protein